MNMEIRKKTAQVIILLAAVCALLGNSWAAEEKYPSHPIELWYAFPPGGAVDAQSRVLAAALQKYLGGTVVSVSKPGGGGVVLFNELVKSRPDGYAIAQTSYGSIVETVIRSKGNLSLDDVKIIGQWNLFGNCLAVPADSPFKTFQDLLDHAKKNPGLTFGNPGVSATPTVRMENLNAAADLKMVGVPFKGDTEVVAALLGKHVPLGAVSTFSAKIQAQAGKLRILFSFEPPAVYGLDPKTPYLAGVFDKNIASKDIETVGFVFVPAKTPDKITKAIEDALEKACKDPEVVDGVGKLGAVPAFMESKEATAKLRIIMERVKAVHEQTATLKK
jgi:tripartite-type tricarboxylate transporter receptor subunit TctC